MTTFIFTLIASIIGGTYFLSYQHPKQGEMVSRLGIWATLIIFFFLQTFNVGYSWGAIEYFKIDKNSDNLKSVQNVISDYINTSIIILAVTFVCFVSLYILSLTVFKTIDDNRNNKDE